MTRKDAQRILDNLSQADVILVGRMYQSFLTAQRRSLTVTGIAKDHVLAVVPKASDTQVYSKWVPALKALGMEHEPFNGSFRIV